MNSTGGLVAHYAQTMNIDEPLAMQRGTTTDYFEADGLGSITSMSSSAGALANTYTYDSFGNVTNSTGSVTNFLEYTGREFDTETGLYYYRARYYDPESGRFMSEDPFRYGGGINSYSYTMNSPVGWIDPTGLAMSASECEKLYQRILRRVEILQQKIEKYDPVTDGQGGSPYSAGGKTGITKPGEHYAKILGMQINLAIEIARYQNECKNGPKLPCYVHEPVNKRLPVPISPKTNFELQMDIQSTQNLEQFWTDVAGGDIALGLTAGGLYLAPVLGSGTLTTILGQLGQLAPAGGF